MAILGAGAFGNLALAGIGIGLQILAAWLFPQKVKGPRLEDLKSQTSKYGDPIARVYGSNRVAGAVIWLKNNHIDEHIDTDRKGSLGPVVTTYTYTADCAIAAVWNGPISGIPRIWADDKLVYDQSAETLEALVSGSPVAGFGVAEGATFTFYLGTDTQAADPNIEADLGSGQAQAWPGMAYFVVTNFPLQEFGQRLPNFEMEVVRAGADETLSVNPTGDLSIDTFDTYGSIYASMNGSSLAIHKVPQFSLTTSFVLPNSGAGNIYITRRNEILVLTVPTPRHMEIYSDQGELIQDFQFRQVNGVGVSINYAEITVAGTQYLISVTSNSLGILSNDGDGWTPLTETIVSPILIYQTVSCDLSGPLTNSRSLTVTPERIYNVNQIGLTTSNEIRWATWTTLGTAGVAAVISPPGISGNPVNIYYDADADTVIVITSTGLYLYDATLENLITSRTGDWGSAVPQAHIPTRIESGNGTFIVHTYGSLQNDIWEYQLSDFGLVQHIDATSTTWLGKNLEWSGFSFNEKWRVGITQAIPFGAGPYAWFMPKLARGSVTLASVIEEECGYVGIVPDVTGITGDVRGYAVRDMSSPRGVIEDLMRVKFFDFTQSGGELKFFMRNSTSLALVSLDDMGYTADQPAPRLISESYADITELPARVVLDYQSLGGSYRKGSQQASKPEGLDETRTTFQFQTSLVLTDDEAAQAADIFFNESRDAAAVYKTSVGPKFLKYHPGDVLELELDETRTITAVITKQEGEFPLALEARKRQTLYTSNATGSEVPPNLDNILSYARSEAVLIDGHLLRIADDSDSFYAAVYPVEIGRFDSATLFKSMDSGATFSSFMGFQSGALVGRALSVLPTFGHPSAWDRASEFTFAVTSITGVENFPSSVTEAQLLADETLNAFAVRGQVGFFADGSPGYNRLPDWEYIRAANVVDNGDGTWTLSTLLRGRRGTEFATTASNFHAIGNKVVYLDIGALDRASVGDKDLARQYVSVTTGKAFDSTSAISFTNRARGLRPWKPTHIKSSRDGSGNLTVTAIRRDRLSNDEFGSDPPMSEETESYKLYIFEYISSGIDVLRTITSATLNFSYSAAEQTTDFGSPQSAIDAWIVQVSAVFGDGDQAHVTL